MRFRGRLEDSASIAAEAAHEKTHKDTDNFLVNGDVRLNT
jgi:hypothetical protein